jgi:ankyrin repeat protein
VQTNNISILERFLDLGLDPNLVAEKEHYKVVHNFLHLERHGRCTALSESIRCGFTDMFDALECRNCLTEFGKDLDSFNLVLIESCRSGNESLVRRLLSNRVSKHYYCTSEAYLAAIETGNEAMVMILVSAGIPLDTTVMIYAIQQKRSTLISLFAHIVDLTEVSYRTGRHTCILHEAVMWGDISVFGILVRAGASLDTNFLLSPQQRQDLGIETLLDDFGRHVNWLADSLSVAVLKENAAMIKVMLASGAVLNANWVSRSYDNVIVQEGPEAESTTVKMTPLTACVIKQNRGLAQLLLDRGMDPLDNAALYMAVILDAEDMIRFLISAFVHRYPSGERNFGTMALISAIRADQYHAVDLLIHVVNLSSTLKQRTEQKYPGMITESISPVSEVVRLACERGNIPDHLVTLLRRQKDSDSTVYSLYSEKLTALQYAITLKSLPVVRLLIEEFGADASSQALFGANRTPLQAAVEIGDEIMVQYLIDRGATVKDQPAHKNGATALQLAAIQDLAAIAVILLENGADVNAEPALVNGRTAFEGATEHGHIDMMRFLVQNGADLVANDQQQHRRAVDYAEKSGQYAAIELANSLLQECLRGEHGIPASFGVGSTTLFGFEEGSSMQGSSQAAFDF